MRFCIKCIHIYWGCAWIGAQPQSLISKWHIYEREPLKAGRRDHGSLRPVPPNVTSTYFSPQGLNSKKCLRFNSTKVLWYFEWTEMEKCEVDLDFMCDCFHFLTTACILVGFLYFGFKTRLNLIFQFGWIMLLFLLFCQLTCHMALTAYFFFCMKIEQILID